MLEEGVALSEQIGDRANLSYFLEGLAIVAGMEGEAEHLQLLQARPFALRPNHGQRALAAGRGRLRGSVGRGAGDDLRIGS
jgi:hypothetical protein